VSQLTFELAGGDGPHVERVLIWCDGACRGNPGPASIGAVLVDGSEGDDGPVIATVSEVIGTTTNNVAEYRAAIAALERAAELGARRVELRADSKLLVEQLEGRWKVRQPHLVPLHRAARALLARFAATRLLHVPREQNTEADALANAALDGERRS